MKIYRYSSSFETLLIFQDERYVEFWIERLTYVFIWKVHDLKENPINWFISLANEKPDYVVNMMIGRTEYKNKDFVHSQLELTLQYLKVLIPENFEIYETIPINKT